MANSFSALASALCFNSLTIHRQSGSSGDARGGECKDQELIMCQRNACSGELFKVEGRTACSVPVV